MRSQLKCILLLLFVFALAHHMETSADNLVSLPELETCKTLSLTGTVVDRDSASSLAIIQERNRNKEEIFVVGARTFNGFSISQIDRAGIWISRSNKRHYLPLAGECKESLSTDMALRVTESENPQVLYLGELKRNIIPKSSSQGLLSEIGGAMLAPLVVDPGTGDSRGLVVYNVDQQSLLGKMGVQDGDVIFAVNNTTVVEESLIVWQIIGSRKKSEISLSVERAGNPLVLVTKLL